MDLIIVFSIVLLICACFFFSMSKKLKRRVNVQKKTYRVPEGTLLYSDLNVPAEPLFSKRYRIAGKPDYIVKDNNSYIPVELKSGSYSKPQRHHVMQLAAYCQLLEDTYGEFVPYGRLIYKDSDYRIPFDPRLRFELSSVIKKIQGSLKSGKVALNHNNLGKCRFCSLRDSCTKKLV